MMVLDIKIWMLTGDKLETAENIAKSCKLIQDHFHVFKIASTDHTLIKKFLSDTNEAIIKLTKLKERGLK